MTWRLALWAILCPLHLLLIDLPLSALGLILVPLAAFAVETQGPLLQFKWPWMWLFCNFEDGVDGLRGGDITQEWWARDTAGWGRWRRIVVWSAIRNSVNSVRLVPILSPLYELTRIRWAGSSNVLLRYPAKGWPLGSCVIPDGQAGWYFGWQGVYCGLYVQTKSHSLRLGWDIRPGDELGDGMIGTRLPRAAFKAEVSL